MIFVLAVVCFGLVLGEDHPLIVSGDANSLKEEFLTPHEHISRSQYGAKPAVSQTNLEHPVHLVIIAHTATASCRNITQCSRLVRAMQNFHLEKGMSDIAYNFLIGGDGNIYEGRGWDFANNRRNGSVSVSFIGNYVHDFLSEDMVDALEELLGEGVEGGKLAADYEMVCHNQTAATLSPGDNVYKVVSRLEHFKEGKVEDL